MEKRKRLILVHILQSLAISVLAGVIVAILQQLLSEKFSSLADKLAILGQYWIGGLVIFIFVCLGITFPNGFISIIKSLKRMPVHFGILVKVVIGAIVYLLFMWAYLSAVWTLDIYVYSFRLLVGLCILGLSAGYIFAHLVKKLSRPAKTVLSQQTENQGLDAWLADDQPIKHEDESRFPQHCAVARRILKKLLSEPTPEYSILPNIALTGSYGSGKTSICNLVEDIYRKERNTRRYSELIFCRFEAWQFLSAEAAVKNLIDMAAREVLRLADFPELWRIPQKYVEAIKASGSWWSSVCAVLFGGGDDPEEIVSIIGDALVHLNVHLVIFVDDFDRIEEDTFATQQAVAKALNQLQSLPNAQYVISVGPTFDVKNRDTNSKPSRDLLKLTRFQELVPKIDPGKVISKIKECRDSVLKDISYYFPWAERNEGESDPLVWHEKFRYIFSSIGLRKSLLGLMQTPRVLKCVLRESHAAWDGGLKGEIDWYDLILANALKAAEPAVFEWIARDRDVFIERPNPNVTEPESEANKRYAEELKQRLMERIEGKDPARYGIVKDVVCELFPFFEAKLEASMSSYMSHSSTTQLSQKISLRPNHGADYIERFFAGEVPEGDIPDQPTLQYIRRITQEGFNVNAFESLYLDSQEKLTGPLNKLVQFSGLISHRLAYKICETIFDWIADPEHAKDWPEPERYIYDMLPDVFSIVDTAGSKQRIPGRDNGVADERLKWLTEMVQIFTRKNPLLTTAIVKDAIKKGYGGAEKLPKVQLEHFEAGFLREEERPLLPAVSVSRYALAWLLDRLSIYEGYENFRTELTQKLISEANYDKTNKLKERIVISLVSTTQPARSGEILVENQANERNYDMNLIIPALKKWYTVKWSEEIAKRDFSYLQQAYNLR